MTVKELDEIVALLDRALKGVRQLKSSLRWTIKCAEDWRGSLINNPDPEPLEDFDKKLAKAKKALKL